MTLQTRISGNFSHGQNNASYKNELSIGGTSLLQAISAARSGAKVNFIGRTGCDVFGQKTIEGLRREGIQHSSLLQDMDETPLFAYILDDSETTTITPQFTDIVSDMILPDTSLNTRTLLLLNNDVDLSINEALINRANERGGKTILCDAHSENADYIITQDKNCDTENALIFSYDSLDICRYKGQEFIVNIDQDIVDTSGAFDNFCGAFAACIQAGLDVDRAIRHALISAQLSASKQGLYESYPYLDDIQKLKT